MERRYSSPLRQQQQEMTRNRIRDALIALIADGKLHDFTVSDVAKRAGVSYGSVYRHYPTREALLQALNEWAEKIPGVPPMPRKLEELPAWTRSLVAGFEAVGEPVMVLSTAMAVLNLRREATLRRDEYVRQLIAEAAPGMEPSELRQVSAILRHLSNAAAWTAMRRNHGLSADETAAALSWATEVLIRDIAERAKKEEPPCIS